jgi:hypothetical protein
VSRGPRGAGGCGSDGRGDSLVAAPGLATPRRAVSASRTRSSPRFGGYARHTARYVFREDLTGIRTAAGERFVLSHLYADSPARARCGSGSRMAVSVALLPPGPAGAAQRNDYNEVLPVIRTSNAHEVPTLTYSDTNLKPSPAV